MEILLIIKEIIVVLSLLAGVVIAYFGLRTWNKQLKGTTKYKIAKNILIKTFKLRDEFSRARAPFMSSAEMSNARDSEEDSNEDLSFRANIKRLNKLDDVKRELEVIRLEADAVFGREETEEIQSLIDKVYEVNRSFNETQEIKNKILNEEERKIMKEVRSVLYGTGSAKDKFGQKIDTLVNEIEEKFKEYLK